MLMVFRQCPSEFWKDGFGKLQLRSTFKKLLSREIDISVVLRGSQYLVTLGHPGGSDRADPLLLSK